jgi:hypothetical protein
MPKLFVEFIGGDLQPKTIEYEVWDKAHADRIIASYRAIEKEMREAWEERGHSLHETFTRHGPFLVKTRLHHAPIQDEL